MNKFFVKVEEVFPLRFFLFATAAILFVSMGARFVFAAADAVQAPESPSLLSIAITYGMPLLEGLLAFAVTWIIGQVIRLLGITDQATRLKVEGQLRDALHFAAENGLKYAFARLGLPPSLQASASIIADAIAYVKDKNPDAVAAFGLDDQALEHIILSKLPALVHSTPLPIFSVGIAGSAAETDAAKAAPSSQPAPAPAT